MTQDAMKKREERSGVRDKKERKEGERGKYIKRSNFKKKGEEEEEAVLSIVDDDTTT